MPKSLISPQIGSCALELQRKLQQQQLTDYQNSQSDPKLLQNPIDGIWKSGSKRQI
jgi:hypothetical protein